MDEKKKRKLLWAVAGVGLWPQHWKILAAEVLIVVAGFVVYANSFGGAFVLDDEFSIVKNPQVRRLWPPGKGSRLLVNLSLAVNYGLDEWAGERAGRRTPPPGLGVWNYHLFNVIVHILASLTLFGVVRRTLLTRRLRDSFGRAAWPLALVVALIWMLHPLQTNAVTYVIQRAEALMGLFYLLALYCVIRAAATRRSLWWHLGAAAACMLGATSKEVIVTAPIVLLVYDRIFLGDSFRDSFRRRWDLYAYLAMGWFVLAKLVLGAGGAEATGFAPRALTRWGYAATQFGVIVHYLRLSVWPSGLCLDYWWTVAGTVGEILRPALVIGALLAGTGIALWRKPALGFLGVWFFAILAPTSSVMNLADLAFEHRMYLSLAAVVALIVGAAWFWGSVLLRRVIPSDSARGPAGKLLGAALAVAVVITMGLATIGRNEVYASEEGVWRDVIAKQRHNPRAHNNLGKAMYMTGKVSQAIPWYEKALELKADYADPHYNLGVSYADLGKPQVAIDHYRTAIKLNPDMALAYNNLGAVLDRLGRHTEAVTYYLAAIRISPGYGMAFNNIGVSLLRQGKTDEAAVYLRRAVELEPKYIHARHNLVLLLVKKGKFDEAIAGCRAMLKIAPKFANAHFQLGSLLLRKGDVAGAMRHYHKAVDAVPRHAAAHFNLGVLYVRAGDLDKGIEHYRRAIGSRGGYVQAYFNLAGALRAKGDVNGAVQSLVQATRLKPDFAEAYNELGKLVAGTGNLDEAMRLYTQAIVLKSDFAEAYDNAGVVLVRQGKWPAAAAYYNSALSVDPRYVVAMHHLARLRATCPEEAVRDAVEAVKLAEQVCRLAGRDQPLFLDTLAAAYAAAGRFDDAVRTIRRAIELASPTQGLAILAQLRERLSLYQAKRPLRDPAGR